MSQTYDNRVLQTFDFSAIGNENMKVPQQNSIYEILDKYFKDLSSQIMEIKPFITNQ